MDRTDDIVTPAATSIAMPVWSLRFLSGAVRGRNIALKYGSNVVGSSGECEVMLPGPDVQPRHLVFTVGELAVSVQKLGTATAKLNGIDVNQRRSLVAGDILSVGQIDFQLDCVQPTLEDDDRMFAEPQAEIPHTQPPAAGGGEDRRSSRFWIVGATALLAAAYLAGVTAWGGAPAAAKTSEVDLAALEKLVADFSEVETVAGAGGNVSLRGFVESRERKLALQHAVQSFGPRVAVSVHTAEDVVEQARRFISDPGVAVTYAGQGRLVVAGTVDSEAVRQKIQRLAADLHPVVLVSDKVVYMPKQASADEDVSTQWASWQTMLPARMVGITEDQNGLRHIQLSNGSRYYEGSVLRSGAEIKRIEADRLVLSGGSEKSTP